jgi:hypothetical protein
MATNNKTLHRASAAKRDEFYTQITDIEKEMLHYKEHFKGKTVLCNCDDPRVSNFTRFFKLNFEFLELKKLVSTCYRNQEAELFSENNSERAIYIEYYGHGNALTKPDGGIKQLKGDGDFRSGECIELLKEADIVVTNPPFSLFREYVSLLMKYDKKFIIIGNQNAITYKEIFPLIKGNKIWLGYSIHSGDREFGVPSSYPLTAATSRIDSEGHKFIRVKGVRWFTNLDYKERHEDLILYRTYNQADYPKYDNYDAINVNVTKDIPCDYDGVIGVPITFMDKYNPEQFEIVKFRKGNDDKDLCINGKCPYFRILIRKRKGAKQ